MRLVLMLFWEKSARFLEKLMKFCHKKHGQVHKLLRIACIPAGKFSVFDKTNHLIRILEEQGLSCYNVDDHQLHATHVSARHGNIFHGVDFANAFDKRRDLLVVSFDY
jgi:hypothetical protein